MPLGNLVSFTDNCDLFFVWEVDVTSHFISETLCGTYQHLSGIVMCTHMCDSAWPTRRLCFLCEGDPTFVFAY